LKHSTEEKVWAIVAHLGFLAGGLGYLLGPILALLLKKDSQFVRHHARQALVWQIGTVVFFAVVGLVGFFFSAATVGLGLVLVVPLMMALALAVLIPSVIATVKVINDEQYLYPVTGPYGEKL
jgi:uncharacterized Tic20 family protein